MTNFNIEIVSDPVCPWCYIGKKKLDMAIETHQSLHPEDTFTRTWKPFYVKPHSPEKVLPNLRKQYGEMMANMMAERVKGIGADVGIDFKFAGKTGRTRDAHRLIQLGKMKSPQMQTRVVEELFSSYWEGEADITSHEDLAQAGVKAGLNPGEVKEWLASDEGGKEVDAEAGAAHVNGVPNYRVGKYTIGGAQDPAAFLKIFNRIKATENGEPEGWGSCVGQ
ncbi:thioredoxin-like protein [Leptodontidium sp. 2 PMI_412]|nr:thioredoxin-like protein [Leptodontidium sp. 2 PMI_412]